MDERPINLSPFQDAFRELEKMYERARSPEIKADPELFSFMRTAVIKGFEYSYELSYKFMQRFLETYGPRKGVEEEYVFRELLAASHEYGLITGIEPWLHFRSKRNITSHTYNKSKADEVFKVIPDFLKEAGFLLKALENKTKAKP